MFRPGQPRCTWSTSHRAPRPPPPGQGPWTAVPRSLLLDLLCILAARPRGSHGFAPTHILLAPVLMFLPVPLRQAQFKSLFFLPFLSFPSLIHLLVPFPSSLLHPCIPFHHFPAPSFPPSHATRAGEMGEQHCPDTSRQRAASRAFPSLSPSTSSSVYLAPSFQTKARASQRCQQQRLSHFQVYLGFI